MTEQELNKIIERLLKLPKECEWAEFKLNLKSEEEIGKYISALSNGACLQNEHFGYLVFGINDTTLLIEGTTFKTSLHKIGNEELENWLLQRVSPRVEVQIIEVTYHEKKLAIFQIQAASGQPTCFSHHDYIRVGSITRSLKDFPEKERKIWANKPKEFFENGIALEVESASDVIKLLDTQCYFDLLKTSYPSNRDAVIEKFTSEKFIKHHHNGYAITNLGALLFAKDLDEFGDMDKKDRIRACYQHACLKYITNDKMTNTTLRERFKIANENAAMVSRIIKDTYEAGLIKEENPDNKSRRFVKYIPIWA